MKGASREGIEYFIFKKGCGYCLPLQRKILGDVQNFARCAIRYTSSGCADGSAWKFWRITKNLCFSDGKHPHKSKSRTLEISWINDLPLTNLPRHFIGFQAYKNVGVRHLCFLIIDRYITVQNWEKLLNLGPFESLKLCFGNYPTTKLNAEMNLSRGALISSRGALLSGCVVGVR